MELLSAWVPRLELTPSDRTRQREGTAPVFDSGGKLHPLQRMTINLFISMPLRLKARRLIAASISTAEIELSRKRSVSKARHR
jgi:hypothetical protein